MTAWAVGSRDAELVARRAGTLRTGTRGMRSSGLLEAVAGNGKPVLPERGMSATVEEWLPAAGYIADEPSARTGSPSASAAWCATGEGASGAPGACSGPRPEAGGVPGVATGRTLPAAAPGGREQSSVPLVRRPRQAADEFGDRDRAQRDLPGAVRLPRDGVHRAWAQALLGGRGPGAAPPDLLAQERRRGPLDRFDDVQHGDVLGGRGRRVTARQPALRGLRRQHRAVQAPLHAL
ncbi:hypothetical protein Srubr_80370 [Streptomyces rubradiris]|uniref:Uncharacterized protein n=1 Tax=Streptomyces rubradiris TaxID=285531 RepID=A0ABQ3RQP0_STRRR|nr:hypothetical protein GCM10018792_77020 [Streptomyces rubradiris]GHI58191.1 hypothetical protein Srubr_80370 [Streptomyces rubradiris]